MKEFQLKNIKNYSFSLPLILVIIIFLINVFLSKLPLVNSLDYEFAALNSIILFFFSGLLVIHSHYKNEPDNFIQLFKIIRKYLYAFSLLPFIIGLISHLLYSSCPISENLLFYIILTLPSILFGFTTGRFIAVIFEKYKYTIFIISFLLILLVPILEFYFNPQLYFFNPVFGFYSGTIYDEELSINNLLVSYRLINLLFFAGLIFLSDYLFNKKKIVKVSFFVLVIIVSICFIFLKPVLNYSTSKESLKNALGKYLQTEHSEIYYSNKIKDEDAIKLMALLHDYYYETVKNELKIKSKSKIISFIFYNEEEKKKLFGSAKADVAKPWLNQIYLNFQTYKETLKHEITHVLSSEFGATIFKTDKNINPAIIEGLAMAIENNFDNYPVHYLAKLANSSGYNIKINELFSGLKFFLNFSNVSYTYSGSFIKYLIDTYGIESVKKFYNNSDFTLAFKKNINELEKEYYDFLVNLKIDENKYKAQLYFGSKPIFKKICPRYASRNLKRARKYFNEGRLLDSEKLYQKIYNYTESYESLIGLINSLIKQNKIKDAENLLKKEINKFRKDAHLFNLELILSDIYFMNKNFESAVKLIDSLLIQNSHIEFVNYALTRKIIVEQGSDDLINFLRMNNNEKFNYLIKLNEKEIYYFTIPIVLKLCNDKAKLKSFIYELSNKIKVYDIISSYAAYKLSQSAIEIGDYITAKKLAIKSLDYKGDDYFYETLVENLRLVNWLYNVSTL
ncbi:hypothetical protein [Rosettibacter firmus]|uniref:hypothetical protein n=1 Tax=Rosettibacter firmus TaxID=3111522 RepID=UPI00336BBBE7